MRAGALIETVEGDPGEDIRVGVDEELLEERELAAEGNEDRFGRDRPIPATDLILELERQLGVGVNTVTDDGEFSVEAVRCIGCCGLAPVMTLDGETFGNVKTKELAGILKKFGRA